MAELPGRTEVLVGLMMVGGGSVVIKTKYANQTSKGPYPLGDFGRIGAVIDL